MRTGLKIFAGLLVAAGLLLAALPWWLGVVLHPLARAVGAEFSDYQRIGYTRFRIEGAAWSGPGVRVEATGIEADTPLLWLWRHGGMRDAAVAVEGWRVVVTRRESEPSTPATVDGVVALHGLLGRIAAGLERWAPRVTLRNGAVSWPGATLALDGADWQRGTLVLSGVQWAGRRFDGTIGVAPEGTISVAAEEAAGEALTMRLAWSGADVAGEASAWAQTATITTHFAAHGWLPDEATAEAEHWSVPAERLELGDYYTTVRGGGRVHWQAGEFSLAVNATAEPKPETKAPPLAMRAEAQGDRRAWRLTALHLTAPFAQAELSAPVTFGFGGDLPGGPAHLTVKADLSKQPWIEARGHLEGTVDFKESTPRRWEPQFRLAIDDLDTQRIAVKHAEAQGRLVWPRLEFSQIAVQFDEASRADAHGAVDLDARAWDQVAVQAKLGPAWFARWLPHGTTWSEATLTAHVSGPLNDPAHSGTGEVKRFALGPLKPIDAQVKWRGHGSAIDDMAMGLVAEDSTLDLTGAIDARGMTLRTLEFAPDGANALRLAAPTTIAWTPRWRMGTLRLQGEKRALELSLADDEARTFRLEATRLRSDWARDWVEAREPAWTLQSARVTGAFPDGKLSFAAEAEGQIEIQPRPAHVVFKANGGADGVRLTTLSVVEDGRVLTRATGRIPIVWDLAAESPLRTDFSAPFTLELKSDASSPLWPAVAARLGVTLTGAAADVRIAGTLDAPSGDLTLNVAQLGRNAGEAAPTFPAIDDLNAKVHFDASAVTLHALSAKIEGQAVTAQGKLPMSGARWRQLWREPAAFDWRTAEGSVEIPDADMAPLARSLPALVAAQGRLSAHVDVTAQGHYSGRLKITNAATRPLMPLGVVQEIDADLELADRTLTVRTFAGKIGGQPVSLQGTVTLPRRGRPQLALALTGKNLPLVRRAGLLVRSDLDLRAETSAAGATTIAGTVNLRDCLVLADLSALLPTGERGVSQLPPYFAVKEAPFSRWGLKVEVRGEHSLRARTAVFRGTASAHFQLSGTLGEPRAVGELTVDQGQVLFPFATLDVQLGTVRLSEADPYHPQVNANATTRRYGYDLRMEATGPLQSPYVTLTANPALESSQVLLMVMTGQVPATGVGGTTGQQRLARVGAFVGQGLLNNLTGGNDEDRLEIVTGQQVSLQGRETYQIEYKLNDRWSLVGEYDEFDDYNAGLKWRVYMAGGADGKK